MLVVIIKLLFFLFGLYISLVKVLIHKVQRKSLVPKTCEYHQKYFPLIYVTGMIFSTNEKAAY